MNKKKYFEELCNSLKKDNYLSYDLLDLQKTKFFINIKKLHLKSPFVLKIFTGSMIFFLKKNSRLLMKIMRKFFGIKKQQFVQANFITARGMINYYSQTNKTFFIKEAKKLLDSSLNKRDERFFGFGQPFNYQSRIFFPRDTPRTTVTSQAVQAFSDYYEVTNETEYLRYAQKACDFMIKYLLKKDFCFSYTMLDKFHIHNANIVGAAALIRTWYYSQNKKYKYYAIKALNFTMNGQNEDGSWYYWSPPDKVKKSIDNYHTGYILESLYLFKKYLKEDFKYDKEFQNGMDFYIENLFTNDLIPKLNTHKTLPIDIQACAQSIIVLGLIGQNEAEYEKMALKILNWTIKNMWDDELKYFYYRVYKKNKVDKGRYIRWGDAWMVRALSIILGD